MEFNQSKQMEELSQKVQDLEQELHAIKSVLAGCISLHEAIRVGAYSDNLEDFLHDAVTEGMGYIYDDLPKGIEPDEYWYEDDDGQYVKHDYGYERYIYDKDSNKRYRVDH